MGWLSKGLAGAVLVAFAVPVQAANAPTGLGGDDAAVRAVVAQHQAERIPAAGITAMVNGRMLVADSERVKGRFGFETDGRLDFDLTLLTYDEETKGTTWRTVPSRGLWRVANDQLCLRVTGSIFDYEDCLDVFQAGGLVWTRYTDCATLSASSACRKGQLAFAGRVTEMDAD